MKAVISNRIYLNARDPSHIVEMEKALTYKIDSYKEDAPPTIIKNLRKIRDNLYSIPVGRTDLIPKGYTITDKRLEVPANFPKFQFELRPSQQEVYDNLIPTQSLFVASGSLKLKKSLVLILGLLVVVFLTSMLLSLLVTCRLFIKEERI